MRASSFFPIMMTMVMMAWGCAHANGSNASNASVVTAPTLNVPPIGRTNSATDSVAVHFNENSPAPAGCFGLSRRTGAVACIIGAYSSTAERGNRMLTILSSSDDQVPDRSIDVALGNDGVLKLDAESLRLLEKTMREGDYMKLAASASMASGTNQAIAGMIIGLTTSSSRSENDDQQQGMPLPPKRSHPEHARETDLRVSVVLASETDEPEANADSVLLHNTVSDITCASANLNIRVLETNIVLIERECHQSDSDIVIGAWLCDSEKKRCD